VPDRHFTLAEARAALEELRPVAERMVELHTALAAAVGRLRELRAKVAGNGGGLDRRALSRADAEAEQLTAAVEACVARIQDAGAQVKDPALGLLDFPSLRRGREILLCWHVGEAELAFWHGLDEGYAGRKPVDPVE
jgi:hypothetical protein